MNAIAIEKSEITPNSAIAALISHPGPVLVDFDETVYLRNSTEDFIDSARPALLAIFVLRFLDALRPWRWTGGEGTRDVWRVRAITTLFPWTKKYWLRRVGALAASWGNRPLLSALQARATNPDYPPAVIATLGFDFIVEPLAAALGVRARIVACRVTTFEDRREGKLRLIASKIGHEAVRRSLVLTDSQQDSPLLDACEIPLRTEWPQARFRPAMSGHYFPGQYLTTIKRPGERYIARGILQEDFALWVLASIGLSAAPIAHVFALLFLLLSFWAIYESGYVDNDRIAAKFEHDPKLSGAFREASVPTPMITPWIWALVSGAIGVVLLRGLGANAIRGFGAWTAVLAATYGGFALYNRFDKSTRIWWYAGLQLARSAAFVVLVPITVVGALAIGAHVLAKWVPYYIYRAVGKRWPAGSHFLTRLLFFAVLVALIGFASGFSSLLSWTALALLAWNVYRARQELMALFFDATRLDKQGDKKPLERADRQREVRP